MQLEALVKLREQIAHSAQELALNGSGSPEERVSVLMGVIRSTDPDQSVYNQTYEVINQTSDNDLRLRYLLDFLYELDEKISEKTIAQDTHQEVAEASPSEILEQASGN